MEHQDVIIEPSKWDGRHITYVDRFKLVHTGNVIGQEPGGKLLLVTCSIWPMESELQAATFAQRHAAIRLDAPGQMLPESDGNNDHDGLFYALFQKPAT